MIEILIPTYNRAPDLIKNILHINQLIESEDLRGKFRLVISNNASTDNTEAGLETLKAKVNLELIVFKQNENIGLEKNVVFTLEKATTEYVIFLGDDDYFPKGYLSRLVEIAETAEFGVVIPGYSELMPDGEIRTGRKDFVTREYEPGFKSLLDFSNFGHQLSGLFFRREGVVEAYKMDERNRNLYLFIFFISHVMLEHKSIFLPEFQVLVSQGNSKDWNYDDSGLLIEMFKNYHSLFPGSKIKRFRLNLALMSCQTWRMRFSVNPMPAVRSFLHLFKSKDVDLLLKMSLPVVYPYFYIVRVATFFKRKLA